MQPGIRYGGSPEAIPRIFEGATLILDMVHVNGIVLFMQSMHI